MPRRKGERYDWLLVGFGVLAAAVCAQEGETAALILGLTIVGVLFAALRLGAWWLGRRERGEDAP